MQYFTVFYTNIRCNAMIGQCVTMVIPRAGLPHENSNSDNRYGCSLKAVQTATEFHSFWVAKIS